MTLGVSPFETGAGQGTRTPNQLVRSQLLYPIELVPRTCWSLDFSRTSLIIAGG